MKSIQITLGAFSALRQPGYLYEYSYCNPYGLHPLVAAWCCHLCRHTATSNNSSQVACNCDVETRKRYCRETISDIDRQRLIRVMMSSLLMRTSERKCFRAVSIVAIVLVVVFLVPDTAVVEGARLLLQGGPEAVERASPTPENEAPSKPELNAAFPGSTCEAELPQLMELSQVIQARVICTPETIYVSP